MSSVATPQASTVAAHIQRVVSVLDALAAYYDQLREWLRATDPARSHALELAVRQAAAAREHFERIAGSAAGPARDFELVHTWRTLTSVMGRVYDALDFELPTSGDMSTTNSVRLTDAFARVAHIYRVYTRDLAGSEGEVVGAAARRVQAAHLAPDELQRLWRTWPESAALYGQTMSHYLQSSSGTVRAAAEAQIESDKSWVLAEDKLLSPYLSFSLVSTESAPVSWAVAARALGAARATTPTAAATATRALIELTRLQPGNCVQQLPTASVAAASASAVHAQILAVSSPTVPNWSVRVHGQLAGKAAAREYAVVERIGTDAWRVLRAQPEAAVWQAANTLSARIASQEFARPGAYQRALASAVELDPRVAHLVTERAPMHDTGLNVLRITDALLQCWRTLRGTARARLDSDKLDEVYEGQIAAELDDVTQRDALLYWVEWSRRDFRKTLDVRVDREGRAADERGDAGQGTATSEDWGDAKAATTVARVRGVINDVVADLIKRNANIFQELRDLAHRLDIVATATRVGVAGRES